MEVHGVPIAGALHVISRPTPASKYHRSLGSSNLLRRRLEDLPVLIRLLLLPPLLVKDDETLEALACVPRLWPGDSLLHQSLIGFREVLLRARVET